MNRAAKICLGIAAAIMLTFFAVQTCIVLKYCEPSYALAKFGYVCVISFMPPFFYVVYSYVSSTRIKEENIALQLRAIDRSSIVVTMDMDVIVQSVNPNFCKAMGYSPTAVPGLHNQKRVPNKYGQPT